MTREYYQDEIGADEAQGALADSALQPGDNISELNNDSGYVTSLTINDLTDVDTTGKNTGRILEFDASGNLIVGDKNGGATQSFIGLTDTPSSYAGQGGKIVTVKLAEDGLEFTEVAGSGLVDSVFGRVGAVVALSGDYDSDQVDNVSSVTGTSVSQALNNLEAAIPDMSGKMDKISSPIENFIITQDATGNAKNSNVDISLVQNAVQFGSLAPVATTGSYTDLFNIPSFSTVATTGSYTDLINSPSLAPVATTGSYTDLFNIPSFSTVATTGSYTDLFNIPSFSTVATTGSYTDLINSPSFSTVASSGSYFDLINSPDSITTLDLIDSDFSLSSGEVVTTSGFYSKGDGGGGMWRATSTTGLTASQTPAHREAGELVDGSGRLWEFVSVAGTRLKEVTVEQLGAIADGTTDCEPFFTAAHNSFHRIIYSAGTYATGPASIGVKDNTSMIGAGKNITIIKKIASSTNVGPIFSERNVGGTWQGVTNFDMRGISLEGNGDPNDKVTKAAGLLRFYTCENVYIADCSFYNSRNYGFGIQGRARTSNPADQRGPSLNIAIERCDFYSNGKAEYLTAGADTHDGVDIKSSIGVTLRNCKAWDNGDGGFDVRGADCHLIECEAFNNANTGASIVGYQSNVDLGVTMGGTVQRCKFYGNGLRGFQSLSDDTIVGDFYYDFYLKVTDCEFRDSGLLDLECTKLGTNHKHNVEVESTKFINSPSDAIRVNNTNPCTDLTVRDCVFDEYGNAVAARSMASGGSIFVLNSKFNGGISSRIALPRNAGVMAMVDGNIFRDITSGTVVSSIETSDYAIVKNNRFINVLGTAISLAGVNNIVSDNIEL